VTTNNTEKLAAYIFQGIKNSITSILRMEAAGPSEMEIMTYTIK
jgi:hypothetical protein